jgi:hypothetical protein
MQKLEIMTLRKKDNMRDKGKEIAGGNPSFIKEIIVCNRCDGRGELSQYRHIEGGICFKFRGKQVFITIKNR